MEYRPFRTFAQPEAPVAPDKPDAQSTAPVAAPPAQAEAQAQPPEDIAALKERPLPGIPVVSNIAYLGMYPDATLSALAIGAIIEVIPLAVILLPLHPHPDETGPADDLGNGKAC